jgi:hypothetical protein
MGDSQKQRSRAECAASLLDQGNEGRLAVAALGSWSGGAGTTAATAASATLAGGTCTGSRSCRTILRCAFGCLYLFATLVIAFEVVTVVVEVVSAF